MGDYEENMLIDTYPVTEEEEIEQEKAEQKRLEEEQTKDLKEIREAKIEKYTDELMLVFKLNIKPTKEAIKEILNKHIK